VPATAALKEIGAPKPLLCKVCSHAAPPGALTGTSTFMMMLD